MHRPPLLRLEKCLAAGCTCPCCEERSKAARSCCLECSANRPTRIARGRIGRAGESAMAPRRRPPLAAGRGALRIAEQLRPPWRRVSVGIAVAGTLASSGARALPCLPPPRSAPLGTREPRADGQRKTERADRPTLRSKHLVVKVF
eukprot:scaffold140045_cov35-Tisochrysis_lutea.AAC.2